jgi:hypothetical protein
MVMQLEEFDFTLLINELFLKYYLIFNLLIIIFRFGNA